MSKTHWIYFGVAAVATFVVLPSMTNLANVPGISQVSNLGYNLGHGDGFSLSM